jgi:hypothetical protein
MRDYQVIQLPLRPAFRELSVRDIRRYFNWFLSEIPNRISILERTVVCVFPDAMWTADFTRESLVTLGAFFETCVEQRPRSDEEISAIVRQSKYPIEIPTYELTDATFSLAMDIGMYLGEMFRRSSTAQLDWGVELKGKRSANYGRPAIIREGLVINPVWLMIVLAYGIAGHGTSGGRLIEIFDFWQGMVSSLTQPSP